MRWIYVGFLLFVLLKTGEGRSRAKAKHFPACYYDTSNGTFGITCSNPAYKTCGAFICCGPDHYCCNVGTVNGCCRNRDVNKYEITGIVLGAVGWLGNLIVIFTCVTPQVAWKVKRRFFKKRKVSPEFRENSIELKHRSKHF